MEIMSVVKEHPIPIGIGVVIILLIVFSKGGASAANGGSNTGAYLQSQSIASQNNATIADITMRGSVALGSQSVENNRINAESAIARTGIMADLFATQIGTGAQVQMSQQNTLLKSQQSIFAHSENMQDMANRLDIGKQTIAAGVKVSGDKLAAQMEMQKEDNNYKLNALGKQIQGNLQLVHENAATLPTILQHAETMQRIGGQTAKDLAYINTEAARTKANAEESKSDWGIVKDIGSTIASFLF